MTAQRLLLPFRRGMLLCGYKNPQYERHWGYPHYGIDISSRQGNAGDDDSIYAGGSGQVLAAGHDNTLGYGAAVLYRGCIAHSGGKYDLVARYMHMRTLCVAAGDAVDTSTVIGLEGKEGTADYHLHLELDTDTAPEYAVWSPQVSRGHTFWKKGRDTTLNASCLLWQSKERLSVPPTYNPEWLNAEDLSIPQCPGDDALTDIRDSLLSLARQIEHYLGGE